MNSQHTHCNDYWVYTAEEAGNERRRCRREREARFEEADVFSEDDERRKAEQFLKEEL
jgi:hypothetical protein